MSKQNEKIGAFTVTEDGKLAIMYGILDTCLDGWSKAKNNKIKQAFRQALMDFILATTQSEFSEAQATYCKAVDLERN